MHPSASAIGKEFLKLYSQNNSKILEIGSQDVNGSLRDFKSENQIWIGVDIEPGKGVDIVLESPYVFPFEDGSFDTVIATSVFEHAPYFWELFLEMVRVTKSGGKIYINAPSNGFIHRWPLDCYRFYPDAGISLAEYARKWSYALFLVESFTNYNHSEGWNDFAAVFVKATSLTSKSLYKIFDGKNVYEDEKFIKDTYIENTSDQIKLDECKNEILTLVAEKENLKQSLEIILNSRSWKLTAPLRNVFIILKKLFK